MKSTKANRLAAVKKAYKTPLARRVWGSDVWECYVVKSPKHGWVTVYFHLYRDGYRAGQGLQWSFFKDTMFSNATPALLAGIRNADKWVKAQGEAS